MYKITRKEQLGEAVFLMEIVAPAVAKKAEPGQFVIIMAREQGERIPLTVADFCREKGTVTIIFQVVGATTELLSRMNAGDSLTALLGPLGVATHTEGLKKVAVVGGGVGCAIAFPVAKKLHAQGAVVHSITGFREKGLVILEREFSQNSARHIKLSDDGSWGEKGLVTDGLEKLILSGERYDRVFAIGPLVMMKYVSLLTKKYGVPTTVSMNPIMIDGTGMCGGCRLTVGGQTRFACVDGPEFDGHLVDFDEAMKRGAQYREPEREAHGHMCRLLAPRA